jgi:hypothetical protein
MAKLAGSEQKWIEYIAPLNIDFYQEVVLFTAECCMKEWVDILIQFDIVIANYIDGFGKLKHFKEVSNLSSKYFLYLVPTVSKYNPSISIDVDTGYFNMTFKSNGSGIMTALITEREVIHYSLIERGIKIAGKVKIKDPPDFTMFNKILSMLE